MPATPALLIGLCTLAALIGIALGWTARHRRCAREKLAVNATWQEQIEAQGLEHSRLVDQNRSLMEQVNQFQASGRDASNRAKELSEALKEAFAKRDDLQREIKDVRGNLESALADRERLQADIAQTSSQSEALKEKDDKIFRLSRELEGWQDRLPPLIERFRERDAEAKQLEIELAEARERLFSLESIVSAEETRVEPLDADDLPEDIDASNETINTRIEPSPVNGDDADHEADCAEEETPGGLRDNLKKIKGVGPAIEKTLNELGIFRFSQIASMSEYDIDRVAKRLKGFRSRIYREDWIGQARELSERILDD